MEIYKVKITISNYEAVTEFNMLANDIDLITIRRISELSQINANQDIPTYAPILTYEVIAC